MNENWEQFIKYHLLKDSFIDGVLLFSLNLDLVYQHGILKTMHSQEFTKFQELFQCVHDESSRETLLKRGLHFTINSKDIKFVIRQLQTNSVCCITSGNDFGLVIVKFSFGILVASHSYPISSHVAMNQVQDIIVMLCS